MMHFFKHLHRRQRWTYRLCLVLTPYSHMALRRITCAGAVSVAVSLPAALAMAFQGAGRRRRFGGSRLPPRNSAVAALFIREPTVMQAPEEIPIIGACCADQLDSSVGVCYRKELSVKLLFS